MADAPFGSRAQGSLGQVTVAGCIRAIHAGRKSGVLHLTRAGASKRLYFRGGSLILAGSDLPEDRLGQALVRARMIQEADLERALAAAEAEEADEEHHLTKGIRLVQQELAAALTRVGIETFSPKGEVFDPNQHEAMAQQPVDGAEPGTVVEVYQAGYKLNVTVVRPAKVVVAG